MNIITITKSKTLIDYRDFVRDDKGKLVHKSKLLKNKNTSKSGSNNNNKKES